MTGLLLGDVAATCMCQKAKAQSHVAPGFLSIEVYCEKALLVVNDAVDDAACYRSDDG